MEDQYKHAYDLELVGATSTESVTVYTLEPHDDHERVRIIINNGRMNIDSVAHGNFFDALDLSRVTQSLCTREREIHQIMGRD